jgi:hypothetical protein
MGVIAEGAEVAAKSGPFKWIAGELAGIFGRIGGKQAAKEVFEQGFEELAPRAATTVVKDAAAPALSAATKTAGSSFLSSAFSAATAITHKVTDAAWWLTKKIGGFHLRHPVAAVTADVVADQTLNDGKATSAAFNGAVNMLPGPIGDVVKTVTNGAGALWGDDSNKGWILALGGLLGSSLFLSDGPIKSMINFLSMIALAYTVADKFGLIPQNVKDSVGGMISGLTSPEAKTQDDKPKAATTLTAPAPAL